MAKPLHGFVKCSSGPSHLSKSSVPRDLVFIAVYNRSSFCAPHGIHSPSNSTFNGVRVCFPRLRRTPAGLIQSILEEQENEGTVSEESTGLSSTFFLTYDSWRNPKWLQESEVHHSNPLPFLSLSDSWSSYQFPRENRGLRITCTIFLLSLLGFLSFSYGRLNRIARDAFITAAEVGLNRELQVGRVSRCNPFTGIKLLNVKLEKSDTNPTAPVIAASEVEVKLSGVLRSIFMRRALQLDVHIGNADIEIAQLVSDGPDGLPHAIWDPGIYELTSQSSNADIDQPSPELLNRVLRFIQPGMLTFQDAHFLLRPAKYLEYGHGDEIIEIDVASAEFTFPTFGVAAQESVLPLTMDGDFRGIAKGTPVDGGAIEVQCNMVGSRLADLRPDDVIASLRVIGEGVKANRVASFLNLPFRADQGLCASDISMDFLYKSKSLVPLMRGEAQLNSVGLRFHPDPNTPEFTGINGKLRFEGKTMFLDGPAGELGTLPMTVVGSIHLEDGYNLIGYVRPVDVNSIIETFEVDKFVPVVGMVRGEAQMSGCLDEPVISGWAESVSEENIFDRLPIKKANISFEWDAIAGLLNFSEISAAVKGGGSVEGKGSMYFDMTKDSPYGISQPVHSPRSPKALYWNPSREQRDVRPLKPLPRDELEIDEEAPYRPYDSMRFDFKAVDLKGGDLLRCYGGEYGLMAVESVGLVSGEGVLAGDAKDANCRVLWRSTSLPPPVSLNFSESTDSEGAGGTEPKVSKMQKKGSDRVRPGKAIDETTDSSMLGGGDFRGLVYIKLGDLPEARRVKVRTTVKNFDARRAGWADPQLRSGLRNSPLMDVSMDTYFIGLMFQRTIIPAGQTKVPRTPCMELLGVDGALAVRNLSVNNVRFQNTMNGTFSFSASDFSLSLKDVTSSSSGSTVQAAAENELTIAASLKGKANLCFRLGSSEMVASVSKDEQNRQVANVFARNVAIQDFVGDDNTFSAGETLSGVINLDMALNLTSRTGEGTITVDRPRMGSLNFSSVSGKVLWRDQDLLLEGGTVKYRRSEYQIDARYSSELRDRSEFGWEVNVNIPRASIQDVASLVQSGNSVATAMQSSTHKLASGGLKHSGGPVWIQRLAQSSGADQGTVVDEWSVPEGLDLSEEIDWFHQYREENENMQRSNKRNPWDEVLLDLDSGPSLSDIQGDISGRVTLTYNSRSGEGRLAPSSGSALLEAILDQLTRTTFSFQLAGADWRVGPARVRSVDANGTFEDGVLNIGEVSFKGKDGFAAEAEGRITSAGSVKGSAFLKRAPAELVNQYGRAPVNVTGECDARLEIEGNLSNPRAFGRAVWTDATLNGKQVRGGKTDLACVNGRCILNVDARIGGRKLPSTEQSDSAGIESLNWGDNVVSGLRDLASKASDRPEESVLTSKKSDRRGQGELVEVRVSAPVRFYLLQYLRRRTSSAFWSEVEPVLGGSMPSDDEWILMDIDVKKYGLLLLNTILPELGWERGDSDIRLRVSGTLPNPVVKGRISLSDGKLAPGVLSEPLQGLRGELEINENGLVSLKYMSGRCGGRNINASGDIFISEKHRENVSNAVHSNQAALDKLKQKEGNTRKARRLLMTRQNEFKSALQRGLRGISLEFGEFPINLRNLVLSKLSGKVRLVGTAEKPSIGGGFTFSDGLIFVGNASGPARMPSKLKDRVKELSAGSNGGKSENIRQENGNGIGIGSDSKLSSKRNDMSAFGNVFLNGLTVTLGRNMQVVQPFVLSVDTAGSLRMDGTSKDPEVTGEINLLRGSVNFLATRMSIKKEEKNYVKFVNPSGEVESSRGGMVEPVIKLALENNNMVVRIPECGISTWVDNLDVSNKTGSQLNVDTFGGLLEGIRSPDGIKRLLTRYAVNAVEAGGKAGNLEWGIFPALVSKTGGLVEGELRDELGAGARFEFGGLSLSNSISLDGTRSSKVGFRLWDLFHFEAGHEGYQHFTSFQIRIPLGPVRDQDTDEVDDEKENESNQVSTEGDSAGRDETDGTEDSTKEESYGVGEAQGEGE